MGPWWVCVVGARRYFGRSDDIWMNPLSLDEVIIWKFIADWLISNNCISPQMNTGNDLSGCEARHGWFLRIFSSIKIFNFTNFQAHYCLLVNAVMEAEILLKLSSSYEAIDSVSVCLWLCGVLSAAAGWRLSEGVHVSTWTLCHLITVWRGIQNRFQGVKIHI